MLRVIRWEPMATHMRLTAAGINVANYRLHEDKPGFWQCVITPALHPLRYGFVMAGTDKMTYWYVGNERHLRQALRTATYEMLREATQARLDTGNQLTIEEST